MYEPDERTQKKCNSGVACEYGICSECILGVVYGKENEEENVKHNKVSK